MNKNNLTPTFVFDTRGTTVPNEAISELRERLWQVGERYISKQELEQLKVLSQKDAHSPEFRDYLRKVGPVMTQILKDGLYIVSFFPDVKPAFEAIQDRGSNSRILSKGTPDLMSEMYKQAGLGALISGVNSSVTDLTITDKANPGCYLALEKEIMIPAGESFEAYTSDDPRETNACREAFPIVKTDVFYIDRGQEREQDLAKGIKLIKDLREIL
ncbi:hypothetical protein KY343_05470 [Candidatus Woesearchaeota archaeon]|nr:hypothetical protein [Candidatus Woesearchaeota archaeon]